MMRKRTTAAVALAAASVVLLSACGGESGGDADDIKGADSAKKPSPSASATADNIDRPEITLPKDVKYEFEGSETGDPKKDAVLRDNQYNLQAIDYAITVDKGDAEKPLKFYNKGSALVSAASYIKGYYDDDRSFIGTTRYYDRDVTILKDGAATLTYCADATKTYPKDRKTGKVNKSIEPSAADYTFFSERLEKNDKGVWQASSVTSGPGEKKCM